MASKFTAAQIQAMEDDIAELQANSGKWKQFLASDAWQEYKEVLRGQIVNRKQEVNNLMSMPTQDSAIMRMCKEHEIEGLKFALAMPELLIQDNEVTIQTIQDTLADDED